MAAKKFNNLFQMNKVYIWKRGQDVLKMGVGTVCPGSSDPPEKIF